MKFAADKLKMIDDKRERDCPQCGEPVVMKILTAKNGLGVKNMNLYNLKSSAYCICPKCYSLFALEETAGANLVDTGNKEYLTEDKLIFLKQIPYEAK